MQYPKGLRSNGMGGGLGLTWGQGLWGIGVEGSNVGLADSWALEVSGAGFVEFLEPRLGFQGFQSVSR